MRRFVLRLIGLTVGVSAAAIVWIAMTLPPAAQHPALPKAPATLVTGAFHIHSDRSDGSGTVDAIAAAAARAGLHFVILTDHGDATRPPDPPTYRHGVLCIDAVEISTEAGHLVALNLQNASPYPLAGEGRDVIEDVHRMGGWAVAAHPDSPRPELRWRGGGLPVDGVEWLNVDTEFRRSIGLSLATSIARAWFRGPETIASLFQSGGGLQRWDMTLRAHDTFSLAAVDAHARMGEDKDDARQKGAMALSLPSYETMFRTVVQTVALDRPLSTQGADAAGDAREVLDAIGRGRSFSVVRAYVDAPTAFEFNATSETLRVDFAGLIGDASPVTVRALVPPAIGGRIVILKDGREVASGESRAEVTNAAQGVYRAEVRLPGRGVPWIVSNAIRVGALPMGLPQPAPGAADVTTQSAALALDSWAIEKHPDTQATTTVAGGQLRLRYQLGGGAPAGQYVALATSASGENIVEAITFTASAAQPMRVSVQIRMAGGKDGRRWRKSIYIDQTPRPFRVRLADLEPVDRRSSSSPITSRVQSILLVVDTVNAKPGSSGEVHLRDTGYVLVKEHKP